MDKKNIVIVGGTSKIAEHCARIWLDKYICTFILIVRNKDKANQIANDLKVRAPHTEVHIHTTDFESPKVIETIVDDICSQHKIDLVLIAQGYLPEQELIESNLLACQQTLSINGISPVLFSERFVKHMLEQQYGQIVMIGSVAGDRGKRSNYIYGAAKSLIDTYSEGLQQRLSKTNLRVTLIKPGPTATPMTQSLTHLRVKLTPVEKVAQTIIKDIERNKLCTYIPRKWSVIMRLIKLIPRRLFSRLEL